MIWLGLWNNWKANSFSKVDTNGNNKQRHCFMFGKMMNQGKTCHRVKKTEEHFVLFFVICMNCFFGAINTVKFASRLFINENRNDSLVPSFTCQKMKRPNKRYKEKYNTMHVF